MRLDLHHISKSYGNHLALSDVSISIRENDIVGLVGKNGAGKSTLLKIIAGLLSPSSGSIELSHSGSRIGYLSERNPLPQSLYVREYLHGLASLHGLGYDAVDLWIHEIGLKEVAHRPISELSKGYKQRLGLASVLIHDPEIIILDEPINGLDPLQIIEYRRVIQKAAIGKIVILSSHLMQEIDAICNRIVVLNDGRISSDFRPELSTLFILDVELDQSMEVSFDIIDGTQVKVSGNNSFRIRADKDVRTEVFDHAVSQQVRILKMDLVRDPVQQLLDL
ncbi:MAG: ATP-binding cassette domain-containing protein [Bacteroidota bacterium]